jgi:hypothetical protein
VEIELHLVMRECAVSIFSSIIALEKVLLRGEEGGNCDDCGGGDGLKKKKVLGFDFDIFEFRKM